MGRWADQDSDEQRLPEGMQRVGYDADTQTYTYRDARGKYYEGDEGNRYGVLHPVGQSRPAPSPAEVAAQDEQIKKSNREAVRTLLPFALLVLVFLLLLFNFVNGSFSPGSDDKKGTDDTREQVHCGEGNTKIQIKKGDTCWAIAESYSMGVEGLLELKGNEDVDCEKLGVGRWICVPGLE